MIFVVLAIRLRSCAFCAYSTLPVGASTTTALRADRADTGAHKSMATAQSAVAIHMIFFKSITAASLRSGKGAYSSVGTILARFRSSTKPPIRSRSSGA